MLKLLSRRLSDSQVSQALTKKCSVNMDKKSKSKLRYKIISEIASGGCAIIYKARDKFTNEIVAIKKIKVKSEHSKNLIIEEIAVMKALKGNNSIVQYLGDYVDGNYICIVMEYIEGWCLQDIVENLELNKRIIVSVCSAILRALKDMHSQNIIHRDIKCGNIMITKKGEVKLIDFGFAHILPVNSYVKSGRVGSIYWMAPEILSRDYHNETADIWSLGITVLEMFLGDPPYYRSNEDTLMIEENLSRGYVPIPDAMPCEMQNFIKRCLNFSLKSRPSAEELLKDKFLAEEIPISLVIPTIEENLNKILE